LRQQVRWSSHGGDCCTYGFLANGGLDLVVDRGLQPYDWCALVPIVQEAGGVITDWQGRALSLGSAGDVLVAGTAALAAAARTVLADAR
jgi:fructose-1,6-bisphosphatase/inositol monophosphatase family enzyme